MAMNLLTNRRKKTRGGSVYISETRMEGVEDMNEPIGRTSIASNSRVQEEHGPQPTPALARDQIVEFSVPRTAEAPHLRKAPIGDSTGPQPPHPARPEARGEGGPGDHTKGRGNALETIQARFTAARSSRVWDIYVKKAEEEDKDLVEDWDRVIDVTLVFAALFSAISTGFVLESSKNLQPDQAKATVLAIQSLAAAIQAGTNGSAVQTTTSDEDSFQPTILTIWVNCLWLLSLGLSISVSLFAMLAKRWCYVFRSKRTGTSHERAMKRQKSWDAIEQWKIELVIEQLPTLMHIALMLFFFGLVLYLAEVHQTTMIVTAALVGSTITLYFILTVLPLWYQTCPMVTPFTRIMQATHQYIVDCFNFIVTRARSYFKSTPVLDPGFDLYAQPPNADRREFLGAFVSAPKKIFRQIRAGPISSWKLFLGFIVTTVKQQNASEDSEWVIRGRTDGEDGKTAPRPQPDESNRYAFRALAWVLSNSTEWETVKEVLDYATSFPDVILDSAAGSDELHNFASTAVEHLNRLQHDPAEWRHTLHINSSCARLIYLTKLPWLHQSTDLEPKYPETQQLSNVYRQLGGIDMSPEEVQRQVAIIGEKLTKLSEPVAWLEDLAGRIVLGCTPEPGLKMCTALGRTLLNKETSLFARRLDVEVYPTLWWIFLNTVMDSTENSWPYSQYEDRFDGVARACSDSALTLSHFRNSRKRQESGLWLAVVGITGMLYAFIRYPDHDDGPVKETNQDYFLDLINFLRLTLRTQVTLDADPFIGSLPVYNGTEIRLYEFDSLQYGIDALSSALNSPLYDNCSFSNDLRMLLRDLTEFKGLKDLLRPKETTGLDHGRILEAYKTKAQEDDAAGIFLTTGVLLTIPQESRLDRERTHLLANFLPDIIFGRSESSQPAIPTFPKGCIGMAPTPDQCIEASEAIAIWAWMPFSLSYAFQYDLRAKDPKYKRREMLWEPLEGMGLLRDPFNSFGFHRTYTFFSSNYHAAENSEEALREAYRAIGYCLYIKASLLDRLYSSTTADAQAPDVLAWSIALAPHVVELLQFWDAAKFDSDEQVYIISSLVKLINTLLDTSEPKHPAPSEPIQSSQNPMTTVRSASIDTANARSQLEALIKAGVLPILARPFSSHSQLRATRLGEHTPGNSGWHNGLARTIERLARTFPSIRAEKGFATAVDDALREWGKPEWTFNQERETLNGDGWDILQTPRAANDELDFYSYLVAYYEANALENSEEPSPMLELVKRLRDDMEAQRSPASPRVESPIDLRIDMSQGL